MISMVLLERRHDDSEVGKGTFDFLHLPSAGDEILLPFHPMSSTLEVFVVVAIQHYPVPRPLLSPVARPTPTAMVLIRNTGATID